MNFIKPISNICIAGLLVSTPLAVFGQQPETKVSLKLQQTLAALESDQTVPVFVYFKDKGDDIPAKLEAVRASLSQKVLKRRVLNRGEEKAVGYNDVPVNPVYLEWLRSQVSKIRHPLKAINAVSVQATPSAVANIVQSDFVARVELVNTLTRQPLPSEFTDLPLYSSEAINDTKQRIMPLDYGNSFIQNNQINVPQVHDLGYSGNNVVIAVFDSGFNRLSHESFSQINIVETWDFVNNDSNVGDENDMGQGSHGTNTLSTMAGYSPGNLIGPAYGATFYLAKTENNESELHVEEDNWCAAAEWADQNGAQIISSSLGYTDFDSGTNYSPSDMDGDTTVVTVCADLAAENGIVVINSAGNSGPGGGTNTLGAPSDGHFVLAVGAVTASGVQSSFSSVGPSADGRIKPDVVAMGTGVTVASSTSDTGYFSANGTSFSCPLTAGVAALVLEANPNLTASEVRDILRNTADRATSPNTSYGYGVIDAMSAVNQAIAASGGNAMPTAAFTVASDSSSLTVDLSNASADSDGTIASFAWDFGDGQSGTDENPSHTYASAGTYTITLTVTDDGGLSNATSRVVTLASQPPSGEDDDTPQSSSGGGGSFGVSLIMLGLLLFPKRRKAQK